MKQSKKQSLIETVTQTLFGLVVSFIIQVFIYKALGIEVTVGQNVLITSIFFIASLIRGYLVRRFFDKIWSK